MRIFRSSLVLSCLAMIASGGAAYAADTDVLDEVVVTAQKRVQNIKDVPISIIVASGESLAKQNIGNLESLASQTPNVYVARGTVSDSIYMRGVGSGVNMGFEQSVATFVDGVYHGRSRYSRGVFVDIERVEVLRGPQSTYFGNNAIGGAFSVVTRKPGKEWEGSASTSYETEGQESITEVAGGGPLSDTLGVRFAAHYSDLGGWLKNLSTGDRNPGITDKFGRITLAWQPSADWLVTLRGEVGDQNAIAPAATQLINCPNTLPASARPGACAYAAATNTETKLDFRRSSIAGEKGFADSNEVMLNLENTGDGVGFAAQFAYTEYEVGQSGHPSSIPVPFFQYTNPEKYDQTSLEMKWTSPADAKINYIVGAYGMKNNLDSRASVVLSFLTPIISFLETVPPAFGGLPPGVLSSLTPLGLNAGLAQEETAYSVFGAVTFPLTEQLSSTVGARWTSSEKKATQGGFSITALSPYGDTFRAVPSYLSAFAGAFTGVTAHSNKAQIKDDAFLPSANLVYKLSDDASAYASYSKGFKAGGFDATETTGDPTRLVYRPEEVEAFELGLKTTMLDGRLSTNIAVFDNEYTDLQNSVVQFTATSTFVKVTNVGKLNSRGIEFDAAWKLSDFWRIGVNVASLDAKYKNYTDAACNIVQTQAKPTGCTQDLTGKSPPFAPKSSGSTRLGFAYPVAASLVLTGDAVVSFSDSYDLLGDDDPVARQAAWQKYDLRLGLGRDDGKWEVAFVGKNLNDKLTRSMTNNAVGTTGAYAAFVDRGKQLALQARVKW